MNAGTTDKMYDNIAKTIRRLKKEGTVAMSYANLKQMTPTTGVTCHPCEYHRAFLTVADHAAMRLKFGLYQ